MREKNGIIRFVRYIPTILIVIFLGITGCISNQGDNGDDTVGATVLSHEWDETMLRIQNSDGTWGDFVDLQGPQGLQGEQGPQGEPGLSGGGESSPYIGGDEGEVEFLNNLYIRGSGGIYFEPDAGIVFDKKTMIIDSQTNNVGIHTSTPDEELEVIGDIMISGDYKYSSAKTFYLQIPVAGFQIDSQTDYFDCSSVLGKCFFEENESIELYSGTLYSPLYLPNGAYITEFRLYFWDSSSTADLMIYGDIYAFDLERNSKTSIAQISSERTNTDSGLISIVDDDIWGYEINPENKQYWVRVSFWTEGPPSGLAFYGCRITYELYGINIDIP